MKYIKEYNRFDLDDFDEEEEDPTINLRIGDIPTLKNDCNYYYRSVTDQFQFISTMIEVLDTYFVEINKRNKYKIDDIKIYKGKELIHFSGNKQYWYDSECWELKN